MKKGYIIEDKFVEHADGNFYTFEDVEDLKAFFYTNDDEEVECAVCGASVTEQELFVNANKCWNCSTPINLI
jgi:hypothetical protein